MKSKVDAIFELRDAAEEHGRAIAELSADPASVAGQDAVLEARSKLEAATADAIDSCHYCGLPHNPDEHA